MCEIAIGREKECMYLCLYALLKWIPMTTRQIVVLGVEDAMDAGTTRHSLYHLKLEFKAAIKPPTHEYAYVYVYVCFTYETTLTARTTRVARDGTTARRIAHKPTTATPEWMGYAR